MTSVLTRIEGDVAVLLLNEPATHHALSRRLIAGLHRALDQPDVMAARAVVIGSVGPYFCAGANLNDLLDGWLDGSEPETDPVRFFERLAHDTRPTIAAVGGGALGGGFELALSCDLTVVSDTAWFSLPELRHGVIPNTALMRLQQMIGLRQMMYAVMTGERISSERAVALGIANERVPSDEVNAAVALATRIVMRVSPGALSVAKRYAQEHGNSNWPAVHQSLQDVPAAESEEGVASFVQKRKADYSSFWDRRNALTD